MATLPINDRNVMKTNGESCSIALRCAEKANPQMSDATDNAVMETIFLQFMKSRRFSSKCQ